MPLIDGPNSVPHAYKVDKSRSTNFKGQCLDELTCGICLHIIWEAQVVRGCGHVFCLDCLGSWIYSNNSDFEPSDVAGNMRYFTCPTCRRREFSYTDCQLIDNIIDKIRFSCKWAKNGCKEVFSYEDCKSHDESCVFDDNCANPCDDCGITVFAKDLNTHNCLKIINAKIPTLENAISKQDKNHSMNQARFHVAFRCILALREENDELKSRMKIIESTVSNLLQKLENCAETGESQAKKACESPNDDVEIINESPGPTTSGPQPLNTQEKFVRNNKYVLAACTHFARRLIRRSPYDNAGRKSPPLVAPASALEEGSGCSSFRSLRDDTMSIALEFVRNAPESRDNSSTTVSADL